MNFAEAKRVTRLRHSRCAAAKCGSHQLLLVQPLTFMNLSGRAVLELMQRYRLRPEQLIVIYDDLDLPPGRIRIRRSGGSGGHRGVQSIVDTVGADFIRLRIGIGKPADGDAASYVLQLPPPQERVLLEGAVERAREALCVLLEQGFDEAMNRFNRSL